MVQKSTFLVITQNVSILAAYYVLKSCLWHKITHLCRRQQNVLSLYWGVITIFKWFWAYFQVAMFSKWRILAQNRTMHLKVHTFNYISWKYLRVYRCLFLDISIWIGWFLINLIIIFKRNLIENVVIIGKLKGKLIDFYGKYIVHEKIRQPFQSDQI